MMNLNPQAGIVKPDGVRRVEECHLSANATQRNIMTLGGRVAKTNPSCLLGDASWVAVIQLENGHLARARKATPQPVRTKVQERIFGSSAVSQLLRPLEETRGCFMTVDSRRVW